MSIRGVGTDIVETARMQWLVDRYRDRPVQRLLTPTEQTACPQGDAAGYLARRFAAKEAAAKALGSGLAGGVRFRDIEIQNQANGCPELILYGEALAHARRLGVTQCHVSISDERHYAIAFVILEGAAARD